MEQSSSQEAGITQLQLAELPPPPEGLLSTDVSPMPTSGHASHPEGSGDLRVSPSIAAELTSSTTTLPLPPKSGIPHVWGQLSSQEKGSQRFQGRSLSEACCRPIWRWRAVASGQWPVHPRYLPAQPGSASDSALLTAVGSFLGRHGVRARFSSQLHQAAF